MFQYGQLKQATQMSRTTLVVLIIVAVLLLQQPDSNLSAAPNSSRFVTLYAHAHPAGEAGNVPILNALSEWALKYYRENLGVTYVFKFKGTPVGFVTLAMASLRKKTCQKSVENRNLSVTCQVFFSATWRETLDSKAKEWAE